MGGCLALIPALLLPLFLAATDGLTDQQRENLCAQARQESVFDPSAVSFANAMGWGQFFPPAWQDSGVEDAFGCPWSDVLDPLCNMRAQRAYLSRLLRASVCVGRDPVEQWALAYGCYNAGAGWIRRERRLCASPLRPDCDPSRWFGHVEETCLRHARACEETRTYNRRIRSYGARETERP